MPKKEFLIGQLEGKIEKWEEEVNRLQCEIDETSEENVKSSCRKKISELQTKINDAEDEIGKLRDDGTGTRIPPIIR